MCVAQACVAHMPAAAIGFKFVEMLQPYIYTCPHYNAGLFHMSRITMTTTVLRHSICYLEESILGYTCSEL